MAVVPTIAPAVLANARDVWNQTIEKYGRTIAISNLDTTLGKEIKAFVKRPKILGLYDRTQASFDQEKWLLLCRADDFPADQLPEKFMKATWDGEDHSFLSVTPVDLMGVIFGYRILVKG